MGIAERLLDACFEFVAEIFNRALQWLNGAWCVGTEGFPWTQESTQLLKCLDIARLAFATFDSTQDLHAPRQTITARCTPAAGLAGKELFEVTHQRYHADLVVDGHRQRRTQTAACFTNAFEFHRQIKMGLGQEVGPCTAWLPGFEFQAITHAASVVFKNFTCGGAKRQFPDARVLHATGEAHQLGTGIFTVRDALIPLHAIGEDCRDVTQGFDVVYTGRFTPDARACRERWLGTWVRTAAFKGVNQCGLFTTDITPCPGVHEQLEVKTGAKDVFTQQARFSGFGNGATQVFSRFDVFTAQEDVTPVRFQRERGDQHAFHQQVRQLFHQQAVFIGARLHFISVTQQVTDVHGFVFWHQAPLQTGGKACAAAPFQASVFDRTDDVVRRHAAQGFTRTGIAVFALVFVEPYRLFVITQTPGQWMSFSSTNYSFHLYCSSRSGMASGVR
ncbi:hypothetical protein EcWSU1_03156 [Enterobacter ludwigii]|uniref:Uncharacterized protein n=1 Tax=Enterobacter ludwigii TaxID=299767 RepID=G8LKS4_9ENTR|nr:hypothetical protein EcWSU1_03156 [Enterobacter ludwigii]